MRPVLLLLLFAACSVDPGSGERPPSLPPPLPHAVHGHRVEVVDGGLLAMGGVDDSGVDRGTAERRVWRWQPGMSEWRAQASLRSPSFFGGSAVVAGQVYCVGEAVQRYDQALDRWDVVVAPGVLPRSHLAAAALGQTIYVLGGYPVERSAFFAVDVQDGSVEGSPPPPGFEPGDHFHLMFALGGELHVVGGLDGESFRPQRTHALRRADGTWEVMPAPPVGMWTKFAAHAVVDGALLVFGEFGGYRYAPQAGWSELGDMEGMVALSAAVAWESRLLMLGGLLVGSERDDIRLLRGYDFASRSWLDRSAIAPAAAAAARGR